MQQKVTAQIGANQISIETGRIARLADGAVVVSCGDTMVLASGVSATAVKEGQDYFPLTVEDRKSTRLNSSHSQISYAVFCLKKKNQLAVVQHIVADQPVEELRGALFESRGLLAQLTERLRQTMCDLYIPALEGADQLLLMVARHTQRSAGGNRAHHQSQHSRGVGAAVDQVAEKDQLSAGRRRDMVLRAIDAVGLNRDVVPEGAEQATKFVQASMDIADDVERSMLIASVYPERLTLHDGRIDGVFRLQGENVSEAFALQEPLRSTRLVALPMDDILPDGAVGSLLVPIDHDSLRHVEDDANDEAVVPLGEFDQRLARLRLHIRRIDDGKAAALQPLRGDQMQHLGGRSRRILRILIIRHQRATEVGGNDLGRFEVLTGKGRFPRP